jgi:hypothetical protein
MTTLLLALTLVVATLTPASAAVITARDSDVTIIGRIEPGDDEVFTDAVTTLTRTVYLVSSGGDLHASVRIAGFVWARSSRLLSESTPSARAAARSSGSRAESAASCRVAASACTRHGC